MDKKPEYSENEMRLIQHISEHWHTLITERKTGSVGPMTVFRVLAEECFMLAKTGPYVDAFRRGYRALIYQGVLRFTEEYEKLIEVEVTEPKASSASNTTYNSGEVVYVDLQSGNLKGRAVIVGCATAGVPVLGKTYIIEPLDFSVYSDTYPFKTCACFESQITKLQP